jgi:hypothetical protein
MPPNLSNPQIHLNSHKEMLVDVWISEHYVCGKIKNNFPTDFVNALTYPQIHKHCGCSYIFILIIIDTHLIILCLCYSITPFFNTYSLISQLSSSPGRWNELKSRCLITNFSPQASTPTLLRTDASFVVTDTRAWLQVTIFFISKKSSLMISYA